QGQRKAESVALLRAAQGFMAKGQPADAIQRAAEAVEAAGDDDATRARALGLQGLAEYRHGDNVAAERHLTLALELAGERIDNDVALWRVVLARVLSSHRAYAQAEEVVRPAVDWLRAQVEQDPENGDALWTFGSSI